MRGELNPDLVSIASGAVIAALGALVLLDSAGAIDLSLGWIAVALTAGIGTILVLNGLTGNGRGRHD